MKFFNFNQLKSFTTFKKRDIFEKISQHDSYLRRENLLNVSIPYCTEQLYMGSTYMMDMTRKDKMKPGFTARTVHIPIELDDQIKMMALKNHVRISDEAIVAFQEHISRIKVDNK